MNVPLTRCDFSLIRVRMSSLISTAFDLDPMASNILPIVAASSAASRISRLSSSSWEDEEEETGRVTFFLFLTTDLADPLAMPVLLITFARV